MSTKTRLPKGLSVIDHNGMLLAKLYDTLIVEFNKETNRLILRNGGWATKHTKKCINLILNKHGLYLVQKNFQWNVYQNGTFIGSFQDGLLALDLAA